MKLLAGIVIGTVVGVVSVLALLFKPVRRPSQPYVEDEDGVQPVDPYLVAVDAARSGTLRAPHIRDTALAAAERA